MKPSHIARLAFCLLVLSAIALPDLASACTGICERVSPLCRRCTDAGYYTGVACRDSGSCGCFYVQCAAAAPEEGEPSVPAMLAELGIGAPALNPAACASTEAAPTP